MSIPKEFLSDLSEFVENGEGVKRIDNKSTRIINAKKDLHSKAVHISYKQEYNTSGFLNAVQSPDVNEFTIESKPIANNQIKDMRKTTKISLQTTPDNSKMNTSISSEQNTIPLFSESDIVSRKQIQKLQEQLVDTSQNLKGLYKTDATDYTSLMSIVDQEHFLYDNVFKELIKQVGSNMHERGEILSILRTQYNQMFSQIPKHVHNIYNELCVQKELNRRMRHELVRVQGNLNTVMRDFEKLNVSPQDILPSQKKATTQGDASIPMNKYLDLYSLRLDRLEKAQQHSEDERFFWMEGTIRIIFTKRRCQAHDIKVWKGK